MNAFQYIQRLLSAFGLVFAVSGCTHAQAQSAKQPIETGIDVAAGACAAFAAYGDLCKLADSTIDAIYDHFFPTPAGSRAVVLTADEKRAAIAKILAK